MSTNRFNRSSPPPIPTGPTTRALTSDAVRRMDSMLGMAFTPQEEYRRAIETLRKQVAVLHTGPHAKLAATIDTFLATTDEHLLTGTLRFVEPGTR